jgi:cytochrome P450
MEGENKEHKTASHPTIFHELLNSDILGPEEKTIRRLEEEGQTVVGAGILTTAHTLKVTSFHILANPEIFKKLRAELASVQPNAAIPIPLQKLEQLPYLTGIVNEGLRMSYGVSTRLARISPDAPLTFHSWSIPPGTPVSMTSIFLHDNPAIFPSPSTFSPERWLPGNSEKRLDKYLVPFSRGTRACLGLNLAYAEMYMALATVFARFEMELWETTREDVDVVHDFVNPSPRLDSKGVRALVK